MIGILVRAILFGIGVEVGRDLYTRIKSEVRPGKRRSDEAAAAADEPAAPPESPEGPSTVH